MLTWKRSPLGTERGCVSHCVVLTCDGVPCRPQYTEFRAPTHMRHTIDALDTKGFANITAVYAVPTTPGRSRVFVRQPFRFKFWLPNLVFSETRPPSVVYTAS